MSQSTIIESIVQRANEIKLYQDHWKLITTTITNLQNKFNDAGTTLDENCNLRKDFLQLLKLIDEFLNGFYDNGNSLDGITYKDLESLLVRFYYQLVEYESELANDYEMRVQILNKSFQEEQLLIQNSSTKKFEQILDTIEQRTKENTNEQLHHLHEKYSKTIESYLRSCIELHQNESISDVSVNDAFDKIVHMFYKISNRIQMPLDTEPFKIPIKRQFNRFKSNISTIFEKNQSLRLHTDEDQNDKEASQRMCKRLKSITCMLKCDDDMTEESFIRTKRWILISGDPKSGKTCCVRGLVHYLAQHFLLKEQYSTEYGPLRLPILIQIREFAEVLKKQPSLTLFEYIGRHHWTGKPIVDDSSISSEDLSCALQDYIQQGQALIILDGLNEIALSDQRSTIIQMIENFVHTYVQIPTNSSNFENVYLSRLFDDASRSGGNQLIITNRPDNSNTTLLNRIFSCFTIQPLYKKSILEFVDYWFFHMHQCIIQMLQLPSVNPSTNHSEVLKKELEIMKSANILEMTSNTGLLSLICTQSFYSINSSKLSAQHFLQFESILKSIIYSHNRRKPTYDLLLVTQILSEIAYCIQQKPGSNFIRNEEIAEICVQMINTFRNNTLTTTNDTDDFVHEMIRIIRDDVGILVLRDESLYGFLCEGFQHYFTCLKLIEGNLCETPKKFVADVSDQEKKIQRITQLFSRHVNDRRFRIPIAFAFGKVSLSWSLNDFDDLCYEFLHVQNEYDSLLPISSYILINSIDNLVNCPSNEFFFDALDCLISAAGQHHWYTVYPFLFEQIANTLRKFSNSIVSLWITRFLSEYSRHDSKTITAFCQFLEGKPHEFQNFQWLDQSICSMLQSLLTLDNEHNGFVVDRLLIKIAFSNHQLLPSNPIAFKTFLIDKAINVDSIPNELFPIIITLYGGLKRDGQNVLFDPTRIHRESTVFTPFLIRFFSEDVQDLKKLKQECKKEFVKRLDTQDESLETIDLCIATICFYSIEFVQQNITEIFNTSLLRACMNRLKHMSMILRQFYFTTDENVCSIGNETTKFISICIEKFQYAGGSRIHFLNLLNSLRSSLARLRSSSKSILFEGISNSHKRMTLNLPNSLRTEDQLLNGLLLNDLQFYSDRKSCSLIYHFSKLFWLLEDNPEFDVQFRIATALDSIPEYLLLRRDEDQLIPLTFIPTHLRNLYVRLLKENFIMIHPKGFSMNDRQHLYFGHILMECLIFLSNASCKRLSTLGVLITLAPWLRIQSLENLGSSLLWQLSIKDSSYLQSFEKTKQRSINYETGQFLDKNENMFNGHDIEDERRTEIIQNDIEEEYKRIQNASIESDERNKKLYAASISLSHVCRWIESERKLSLLAQSIKGAMSIENKVARLDALCAIAYFSYSNYDQIKVNSNQSLQAEIERQFKEIYSDLPALLQTAIFIRCLPLLQHSSVIDDCLQDIFNKIVYIDKRDQEAIFEALLPYVELNCMFSSWTNRFSPCLQEKYRKIDNMSSSLKKYFDMDSAFSLSISNLYLMELANDLYECIKMDHRHVNIEQSIATKLFQFESGILTEAQALTITHILSRFKSVANQHENIFVILNDALHHLHTVEFKACRLLESWLIWKDSNELVCFAYHAALLLINSEFWSIEATEIVCNLLCNDNDRFRQRAETVLRSSSDDNLRTSSILSMGVLFTLLKKKVYYQPISVSCYLTIVRLFQSTTLDVQSHLEILLWLERYRIHALDNKEYTFDKLRSSPNSYVNSFFSTDIAVDACSYTDGFRFSNDLVMYLCDLIGSNFFSFLAIDEDTVSGAVSESHVKFVISILLSLHRKLNCTKETQQMAISALLNLFDISDNNETREAVAYALSYACDEDTHKNIFNKITSVTNNLTDDTPMYSDSVLSSLIASYSYCVSRSNVAFDQDDLDLFCMLLRHQSKNIRNAVRTGFGRVFQDTSFLLSMLNFDYSDCYHALIGATATCYLDDILSNSEGAVIKFIEEHPGVLPIFMTELYDHLCSFTTKVFRAPSKYYERAYSYPTYIEMGVQIVEIMPIEFINFIRDWHEGDNFKHALFGASKQYHFTERAACLMILSLLGELTVDLCRLFIEAVRDDPYVQNNCYKCITHIHSIKDTEDVVNLLLSYLKSNSLTIQYITIKILVHLSSLSLIPFKQVHTILNDLMLNPCSNEDLWLIKEGSSHWVTCKYYNAGPLKDVIYSLLIQQTIDHSSSTSGRNQLNDLDFDFIESAKASRFAACIYEEAQTNNDN